MQYTTNYNFRKPDYENVADVVPAVCENMDILDLEMKKISDKNTNVYTTTNIGNAYSVTIPNLSTLTDGYPICIKFNSASTGNITLNVNSLGAKNVIDYFKNRVSNVGLNLIANLRYESVAGNFQLQGKGGGGNALPSQVLKDVTYTADSGPSVGTIPSKGTQIYGPMATDQTILAGQYLSGPQVIKGVTIESLGGRKHISGTAIPQLTSEGIGYRWSTSIGDRYLKKVTIPLPNFTPSIILVTGNVFACFSEYIKANNIYLTSFNNTTTSIHEMATVGNPVYNSTEIQLPMSNDVTSCTYEIYG